ncbi:MAG: hypothetical protein K2X59_03610, partial [Sphingomonas sp.]|nr:hypothetical protein [Sphingomonas sp.]
LPSFVEGEDMHIHKPKPLHGFRETLGEIGIIVVGILLAIAFEQIVEEIHWSQEVQKAQKALHGDIAELSKVLRYRITVDKCVRQRIDTLDKIIEQPSSTPEVRNFSPGIGFALSTNVWQAQQYSQVLTHFDDDELSDLGAFYFQISNLQRVIDEESHSWQKLEVLIGRPSRLGPADIATLRTASSEARSSNSLIIAIAEEELAAAQKLGIRLPKGVPYSERMRQACAPITG